MRARGSAKAPLLAAVLGTALLAGCGATKEDVVRLETRTEDQNVELRQELAGVRQSLGQVTDAIRQLRADLAVRLDEVSTRMGIVESLMRDNEQMFQRFQRRLQDVQQRAAERDAALRAGDTTGAATALPGRAAIPDTQPGAQRPPGEELGQAGDEETAPPRTGTIPSEIDLYNSALNDYQAGRYDLALAAFREYLRLYPDGTSPDNAQFWVGKIHLDQRQFEPAAREFTRLLASYPESDKAAQATFYLGTANRAMGNEERARAYFREVIERFPASQESQLARRELER